MTAEQKTVLASQAMYIVICANTAGCFFCGWLARKIGYRATIAITFIA